MGTGFHGGFGGGTKGAKNNDTPIKSAKDLRYNKKKTVDYLLNPHHPQGASKAKFMKEVLGYSQEDAKNFHKNVVLSIKGKSPQKTIETPYGIKHTFNTKLVSKDGKSVYANVVVVVQKDNGRVTYKIVTVYPDKKKGG